MRLQALSFQDGIRWVITALKLLGKNPLVLMVCAFLYLMVAIVLSIIPVIGSVAPLLVAPALSLGLCHVIKQMDEGTIPHVINVLKPLKPGPEPQFKQLMILGAVNLATTLVCMLFASLFDDGTIMKFATGRLKPDDPNLQASQLVMPMLAFFIAYIPFQMALWFAPMFVAWHGHSAGKAMFFSFTAIMKSKVAFFGYLFAWMLVGLVISIATMLLAQVFGGNSILLRYAFAPIPIMLLATFFASVWTSYKASVAS